MHLRRSRKYIGAYTPARILLPAVSIASTDRKGVPPGCKHVAQRYVCITIQDTGTDIRHRPRREYFLVNL